MSPLKSPQPPSMRSHWTGWIERRLCAPGDDEETRHRKVQFTTGEIRVESSPGLTCFTVKLPIELATS